MLTVRVVRRVQEKAAFVKRLVGTARRYAPS